MALTSFSLTSTLFDKSLLSKVSAEYGPSNSAKKQKRLDRQLEEQLFGPLSEDEDILEIEIDASFKSPQKTIHANVFESLTPKIQQIIADAKKYSPLLSPLPKTPVRSRLKSVIVKPDKPILSKPISHKSKSNTSNNKTIGKLNNSSKCTSTHQLREKFGTVATITKPIERTVADTPKDKLKQRLHTAQTTQLPTLTRTITQTPHTITQVPRTVETNTNEQHNGKKTTQQHSEQKPSTRIITLNNKNVPKGVHFAIAVEKSKYLSKNALKKITRNLASQM